MRQRHTIPISFLLAGFLILSTSFITFAQSGSGYDLSWSTIDSGGYTFSTGGDYILSGTIGQTDTTVMSGGIYTLFGGFWSRIPFSETLYLPLLIR